MELTFHIPVNDDITLVLLQPHHAEELFSLVDKNRQHLRQFLPWVDSNTQAEHTLAAINSGIKAHETKQEAFLGISIQGKIVGTVHLKEINRTNNNAQIGYWLDESHQGKGIVTKSVAALIEYAFNTLKLHRLEIRCATENPKSCAIPERLGFTREGVLRQAGKLADGYVDLVVYGLLHDEWKR